MQALKWLVGIVGGGFIAIMVFGMLTMSPERSALYEQEQRIKTACGEMMSDSALGNERRMTRAICDQMKSELEAKKRSVK